MGSIFRVTGRPTSSAPKVAEPSPQYGDQGSAEAAVLEWLRTRPDWHGRQEILEALALSPSQWNEAIKALVEAGTVERTGAKRGTRYRASQT